MIDPGNEYARKGITERLSHFLRSDNTGGMFYGWWLVVIGIAVVLVGRDLGPAFTAMAWRSSGFDYMGIGPPWNVVAIAGGVILWIGSLWVAGWGVDRYGPKRMVQIGLPLAGLAALLVAVPTPGFAQAQFAVMSALAMIGAYVPAITALNDWFRDRLALALGLMLSAVAIGALGVNGLPALALIFVDWRLVTIVSGAAVVVAGFALARLVRDRPEDWEERPDGLAPAPEASIPNYSWREAMRSRQFWMLMAAASCVAVAATITSVYDWQIISQGSGTFEAIDKSGSYEKYASTVGILAGGLLSYRFPVRYVLSGAAVAQTVGMALLLSGYGPILPESVVLLGLVSGMVTAPGIAAAGIYFGRRSFGMITVTSLFIEYVASSALLPAAGYSASVTGEYVPMFLAAAIVSLIGAGLYCKLGQPRLSPAQRAEEPAISC